MKNSFPLILLGFSTIIHPMCDGPYFGGPSPEQIFENTKQELRAMGNTYDPEPKSVHEALLPERILNRYWSALRAATQKQKNDAYLQFLQLPMPLYLPQAYALYRLHVAAALSIDADPEISKGTMVYDSVIYDAVSHDDANLAALFFEKKGTVDRQYQYVVVGAAKNIAMVELLERSTISITAASPHRENVLHHAMKVSHDAALVKYWRDKKFDPFAIETFLGWTPLHTLANLSCTYREEVDVKMMTKKFEYLMNGLDELRRRELCNKKDAKSYRSETALQLVRGQMYSCGAREGNPSQTALAALLEKYTEPFEMTSLSLGLLRANGEK